MSEFTYYDLAQKINFKYIHVLAWRDLDDAEAGGSELHAHEILKRFAEHGLNVTMRTSVAFGHSKYGTRNGYTVSRKGSRYTVFFRSAASWVAHPKDRAQALIEVWNGMPFFSPLWANVPRLTIIHHVHAEMWNLVFNNHLATVGQNIEERLAPLFYRKENILTPSESTASELITRLKLPAKNIQVVHPGIDSKFSSDFVVKSKIPLVISVGRLVPVKQHVKLLQILVEVKKQVDNLKVVIAGDGYEKQSLIDFVLENKCQDWVSLPGRISDDELITLYRSAWIIVSNSIREGWGLTLAEAAACGTPSVATDIIGHRDLIKNNVTGYLVKNDSEFVQKVVSLLKDKDTLQRFSTDAQTIVKDCSWDSVADKAVELLVTSYMKKYQISDNSISS